MGDSAPRSERPVILVSIADDGARADVVRELVRRYSDDYRVLETSGEGAAIEALRKAAIEGEQIALLLADAPSSPEQSPFAEVKRLFPDARRGLVIAWGSWAQHETSSAVIDLMARVQIDYYVIRPWRTPDEHFHRAVTDFLLDWHRAVGERPSDATVIGDTSLSRTHELRGLLARRGISPSVLAPDSPDGASLLSESGVSYEGRPLVRFLDGRVLDDPDGAELARAYGLTTGVPSGEVDLAIVGAGPGGLAAAVYAASEGLRVVVIERDSVGGQAGSSSLIRNYLGFSRGVSGVELAQRAYQQAWVFGAAFAHSREAIGMTVEDDRFSLRIAPDEQVTARAVVLATGVSYRRVDLGDLTPMVGAAVFYGASAAEAKSQTGRIVHVVGGGNSAGQAALHLARYASSVTLIARGALADSMSQYLIEQLKASGVSILTGLKVVGGSGAGDRLDHIVLRDRDRDRDRDSGDETRVPSDALFITIGAAPHTAWLPDAVARDRWGFVLTGADVAAIVREGEQPGDRLVTALESSVPGFFAVGDARHGSVKRVASAVGEGSVVVSAVHAHLARTGGG